MKRDTFEKRAKLSCLKNYIITRRELLSLIIISVCALGLITYCVFEARHGAYEIEYLRGYNDALEYSQTINEEIDSLTFEALLK